MRKQGAPHTSRSRRGEARPGMVDSSDLGQVLAEAEDIARSVGQTLTSAHVVLALFTVDNPGARLLRERGVDEDALLGKMNGAPAESEGTLQEVRARAQDIARHCGSTEVDCLHLLIAVTRVRCAAQTLLAAVRLDLMQLRNTALSYFLSGRMPRNLVQRAPATTTLPVRTSPGTLRHATSVAVTSPATVLSPRALVDAEPDEEPQKRHPE